MAKHALHLTLLASLALAACKQEAPAPEAGASAEASAKAAQAAETKEGLSASAGKLVLPAVKGRPGAAYFMVSNSSGKPVTLTGVAIAGAGKAEMHETKGGEMAPLASADVQAGEMIMFERGGKHVMVFDLAPTIKAGDTAELTLSISDGSKLSVPLQVEAAGGGGEAMDHDAM